MSGKVFDGMDAFDATKYIMRKLFEDNDRMREVLNEIAMLGEDMQSGRHPEEIAHEAIADHLTYVRDMLNERSRGWVDNMFKNK